MTKDKPWRLSDAEVDRLRLLERAVQHGYPLGYLLYTMALDDAQDRLSQIESHLETP